MKLMTKQLEKRFTKVGDQSEILNPLIIAKFFNPAGGGTWYAIEYDPETRVFFGYVTGLAHNEWGSFSFDDLLKFKGHLGLGIERDLHFEEMYFNDLPPF